MSILTKIAGGISKVLPIAALVAPQSKRLTQALGTLQAVGAALPGVGSNPIIQTLTGVGGSLPSLGTKVGGAIVSATRGVAPMSIAAGGLPALPGRIAAAGGAVVAGGRALVRSPTFQRISKRAAAALNLAVLGGIAYDMATGQPVARVAGRRINPLNVRAARRAVRRIKSVRKICMNIERCLPKTKRCR